MQVEVEVALTTSDFYQWSARLVDVNGTELDFASHSGSLSAGLTEIDFKFDGEKIGENGVNGPYFVKGLLMFGQAGANVVLIDVSKTQAYNSTQFEGAPQPAEMINDLLNLSDVITSHNPTPSPDALLEGGLSELARTIPCLV